MRGRAYGKVAFLCRRSGLFLEAEDAVAKEAKDQTIDEAMKGARRSLQCATVLYSTWLGPQRIDRHHFT